MSEVVVYKNLQDFLPYMHDAERVPPEIPANLLDGRIYIHSKKRNRLPFIPQTAREAKIARYSLYNQVGRRYKAVYKSNPPHGSHDSALGAVYNEITVSSGKYLVESVGALVDLHNITQDTAREIAASLMAKILIGQEGEAAKWLGSYEGIKTTSVRYKQKLAGAVAIFGAYPEPEFQEQISLTAEQYKHRAKFWSQEMKNLKYNPLVEALIEREFEKQQEEAETEESLMLATEMVE